MASGVVLCSTHLLDIAPLAQADERLGDIRFAAVRQARQVGQGAFAIYEQQHPALPARQPTHKRGSI